MSAAFLPLLALLVTAAAFAAAFAWASRLFGPRLPTRTKLAVYECGMPAVGPARQRFSVKFYLVAVLFILFDLEAVFLVPWALVFRRQAALGAGAFLLAEMAVFAGVILVGWIYVIRRGALDWD
ncbi:MAG: NADH-quinone oxidoreductase subunit A [Deltaproteobacteria bacterium]|nr:NADH-quinone oxidoreductase subunit A [Deltaproteobacteria bacterium]